jgi:hypothetical protein
VTQAQSREAVYLSGIYPLFLLAYTRTALVCLIVLGDAVIQELLQLVVPDRDARVVDAVPGLCALVFVDSKPALGMKDEVDVCKTGVPPAHWRRTAQLSGPAAPQ